MTEVLTELEKHPFAAELDQDQRERLASFGKIVDIKAGQHLVREEGEPKWFYLILEGRVSVELHRPGGEPTQIQTKGPGSDVGWSWVCPGRRLAFDVRALEPTRTLEFDAAGLWRAMEEDHDFGYPILKQLFKTVTDRLNHSRLQLLDIHSLRRRS